MIPSCLYSSIPSYDDRIRRAHQATVVLCKPVHKTYAFTVAVTAKIIQQAPTASDVFLSTMMCHGLPAPSPHLYLVLVQSWSVLAVYQQQGMLNFTGRNFLAVLFRSTDLPFLSFFLDLAFSLPLQQSFDIVQFQRNSPCPKHICSPFWRRVCMQWQYARPALWSMFWWLLSWSAEHDSFYFSGCLSR